MTPTSHNAAFGGEGGYTLDTSGEVCAPAPVPRALVDLQSHQRCAICQHHKKWCQQADHVFTPVVTCESCVHIGARYWGSDDFPVHFCGKSNERRAASFTSTGNAADDFMQEFRRFYDAGPKQTNCGRYFEAKALPAADDGLIRFRDLPNPPPQQKETERG